MSSYDVLSPAAMIDIGRGISHRNRRRHLPDTCGP
jgi:hypothetical protein